jgi:integrase
LKKLNPEGPWVFQWMGRPIDDCNTLAFQKAVARAKVGPLRWHDLRHTGASWAVQSGVPLQQVMELGGW